MGELDEKLNAILGNPEAMGQIMALANSLGGSGGGNKEEKEQEPVQSCPGGQDSSELFSAFGEIDPRMLQMGMKVLREYREGEDKKTALICALRPFVREERWETLDRAIRIAKLSRVIRVVIDAMGKEDATDV